jgi:acyl-lipid omega-6 desaturase (Delta-12 desaturase)
MRDSKTILRASLTYAKEQRLLSWWHLVSTLAVLAGLVLLIIVAESALVQVPASITLGLVFVRFFIIYHDYQHGTILKGSRVAKVLMTAYGLFVLNPPSIWSRSHEHHHRNVGKIYGSSIGSYPVMTKAAYARASRGERVRYVLQRHPVTIALGYVTVFLYGMCVRSFFVAPRQHADSAVAVVLHVALVATLAVFAPWLLLFLVIVPMLVACGLGAYLFYAQHNYPGVRLLEGREWTHLGAALQSSSYIRMGPLMRWFTGNIGYHHVHHVNAKIPFYRLPEAMAAIPEFAPQGVTSLWPWDVWKCLRLRVWDAERGCMTA